MKTNIGYASGKKGRVEEINTLEELIALMKKEKNSIIISHYEKNDIFGDADLEIIIYDSYVE